MNVAQPLPPRAWGIRERDHSPDEQYQLVCGHYVKVGRYRCEDCNLAPLSLLKDAYEALRKQAHYGRRSKIANREADDAMRNIEAALGWFQQS